MIEYISRSLSVPSSTANPGTEPSVKNDGGQGYDVSDHSDFQAMLEGGSSDNIGGDLLGSSDVMNLVRNVDTSKANMQSALMHASVYSGPASLQAASVALSRYDIQTLFLSKVASKTFQAVDRLTNLQ